jgi:alpha-tubulin suppressor-like RCC1 family protein
LGLGFRGDISGYTAGEIGLLTFPYEGTVIEMAAGGFHACVRTQLQHLRCWGLGAFAELGRADTATIGDNEVIGVVGMIDFVHFGPDANGFPLYSVGLVAGRWHTCAILNDGSVRCWGNNPDGQLGLGFVSTTPSYVGGTPTSTPDQLPPVEIFAPTERE